MTGSNGEITWKTWNPSESEKPDPPAEETSDFIYEIKNNEAIITGYTGSEADLIVPEKLGGYPVAVITQGAFSGNIKLEKITLPTELRIIGEFAFMGCSKLTQITIPGNVEEIGKQAFTACRKITEIVIPESVKIIGEAAFMGCEELNTITISGKLKILDTQAFYHCGQDEIKVYFQKGTPAFYGKKIFASTNSEKRGVAYYPIQSDWNIQTMNELGIRIWKKYDPNEKNPKKFQLREHNNSYVANNSKYAGFQGEERVTLDDTFYNSLVKNASSKEKDKIDKEMQADWPGVCHGIAITMGLAFEDYISMKDMSGTEASSYYNLPMPYENPRFLNMINYYFLSQFLEKGGKNAVVSTTCDNIFLSGLMSNLWQYDSLRTFLKKLVNAASDDHVLLFSYTGLNTSVWHSVLITGYSYDAQTKQYILDLYDENSLASENNMSGEITQMKINGDFSKVSFITPNGKELTEETYGYMKFYDWNKFIQPPTENKTRSTANLSEITFGAGVPATVKASNGKYITYDGSKFSGDMTVYDVSFAGEGSSSQISVKTDYCESFKVSSGSSRMDVEISDNTRFMAVEGKKIAEADFSMKDGIALSGTGYSFLAYVSTDAPSAEKENLLVSVSANASSDVKISPDGDSVKVNAEKPLESVETKAIQGTKCIEEKHKDQVSDLIVDKNGQTPECSHKWSAWKTTVAATVFATGEKVRECEICKHKETGTISKLKPTISVSKKTVTLKVKQSAQIKVTYAKGDKVASWKSSDKTIASVDSKGKITGKKAGKAIVTVKLKSGKYAKITVTVQINKPSKPVISGIRNTASGVYISWKKVSGASKYYVYRSVNGSSYKRVKTLTGISWIDTGAKGNGTKYQYKIYANNSSGNSSAAVTKAYYFLPRMQKPQLMKISNAIVIGWNVNLKGSGYQIQYATNSKFTDAVTASTGYNNYNRAMFSALQPGKTYYIRIRSYKNVSGQKSYSYWSSYNSVKL